MSSKEKIGELEQIAAKVQAAKLEQARRQARSGDPLPFIRIQWPQFIIPEDHPDRHLFETDLRLDKFQLTILRSMFDPTVTECSVKGCCKAGKGFSVSLGTVIWFEVFEDSRVILLGPSHRHGLDVLFAEISDLKRRMKFPLEGTYCQSESIVDRNRDKHEIVVVNPSNDEGLSGRHSPKVLFVFDESSSIPGSFYVNALKQSRMIVAISNPRTTSGWYRDLFGYDNPDEVKRVRASRGWRQLVTISGDQCMNVVHNRISAPFAPKNGITINGKHYSDGEVIPDEDYQQVQLLIPSQIDRVIFDSTMASPSEFERVVFGLGQFPKEDIDKQIIFSSWLQRHRDAWVEDIPVTAFGLDVAASQGGDSTILSAGGPNGCVAFHAIQSRSNIEIANWVLKTGEQYGLNLKDGHHPIAIDWTAGYGAGVGQILRGNGVCVIECHSSERSNWPHIYENMRAEIYGELAKRLDPNGPWGLDENNSESNGEPWALPSANEELFEELLAHEKVFGNDNVKWGIIPKDRPSARSHITIKSKIGRSPDYSDSLAYLWKAVSMQSGTVSSGKLNAIVMSVDELLRGGKRETIQEMADRVVESKEYEGPEFFDPLGAFR